MQSFKFLLADITTVEADCIVNPTDTRLSGGGGVDRAIHRAGGWEMEKICRAIGSCHLGGTVVTDGFQLPANYVIHTAVPDRDHPSGYGPYLLAACYVNVMEAAKDKGASRIVFPAMGTGIRGFAPAESAQIALETLDKWCRQDAYFEITFAFTDENLRRCYQAVWNRLSGVDVCRQTTAAFRELCSPVTLALHTANTMLFQFEKKGGYVTLPEDKDRMADAYEEGWYQIHQQYYAYMTVLYQAIGSPSYQDVISKALKRIGHSGPDGDAAFLAHLEQMDFLECVCFLVIQQRADYWSGGVENSHMKLCASGAAYRILCHMQQLLEKNDVDWMKEDWTPVHS